VEFRSTGTWVRTITKAPNGTAWRFLGPLLVKPNGNILVTENAASTGSIVGVLPHTIQEYSPSWAAVHVEPIPAITTAPVNSLSVRSLALDAAGDLLAGAQQDRANPSSPTTQLFVFGLAVLRDGSQVWSTIQSNLYPHLGTAALLKVSSSGQIIGALRDGLFAVGDGAQITLDCGGDLVLLLSMGLERMHVTTPVSCLWKPTAITGAVIARSATGLKVRGYSNPSAQVTRMRILYGPTAAHGKYTAWITLPSDNAQLYRDIAFGGLLTKHAYHYAVQVTNASGTVTGADKVATTA
jgi:hypothetical protein